MPAVRSDDYNLIKRFYYTSGDGNGARWAFFAILIVLIIIFILGTIRVNKGRARRGNQPIYGTRWMTPPSYLQSQGQYDHNSAGQNAYVPTYTATANDNDLGYYDPNGNFHSNPNTKAPQVPEAAHYRSTSNPGYSSETGGNAPVVSDESSVFRRPSGPPPNGGSSSNDNLFQRPNYPPPQN